MARTKFQTLTEPMFYILLCLKNECCGMDIMERVTQITSGRVTIGPGTLYNLLEQFLQAEMIFEIKSVGRRRSYILTEKGYAALEAEHRRLQLMQEDYLRIMDTGKA